LIGLLVLLGTGSMGEVRGQSLRPGAQDKLPPRLRVVATGSAAATQLAALVRPVERKGDAPRYAVFLHARNAEALQSADLDATSVGGDLFTARLTPAGLRRAARMKAVESVEPGRRYAPLNDLVRAATGAHPLQTGTLGPSYTGDGTLACVIDTGIDWTHPDFRGPDASSTRIRALWDQTLAPGGAERPPAPFAYGVEYTRGEIENALASGADGVRTRDSSGHGTHVAATVAGSGAARTDRPHRGLAPEAGIVAVKTDFSGPGIADGLRYCRSVADRADRPVVATLSLGALHGPHDGSAPLARAVDAFTGPGRSVVAAAGNSGDRTRHLTRSLPASGADSLRVQVPRSSTREGLPTDGAFRLDVWLPRAGRPTAVTAPGGARIPLSPDTAAAVPTPEGTVVYAHSEAPNGTRHFEVAVRDVSGSPPASGTWTVVLENGSSASGPLHAWLSSTTNSRLPNGDVRSTLTVPATARSALAVGAWTHRTRWQTADGTDVRRDSARAGRLAPFSSRGPTRGGPRKPDLVAPGAWTVSARSRTSSPSAETTISPHYALRRGTSTAAAAAAGAVALLLEADPSLTASRLGTLLRKTARPASSPSRDWTPRRGHGQLDVFGAMARLHGASVASRTRSFLALDDPSDPAGTHTLGGAGPPALSRRFTPETSGIVDGLLLRTPSGTANRLRDSLAVSIWTDENGVPGRPIAAPARVGPDALANHTTTHLSLSETGAVLSADTTYHLVLDAPDEAGALDIVGRPGRPGSGSLARIGGEWTPQSTTLGVDVTTAFAADLSSPRLSDPATAAILEAPRPPTLSWDAVPSADAYTVQVSSSSEFEPARTDTLRSDSTALRLSTLAPSTGYHWRVRAERLGHPGPWSDARSFLYYPSTIPVRATQPFAADETSSPRFRLVALPGQSDRPVDETLAARPDGAWTAYRDRGRGAESLVPFDDSSPFRLRPGTGFWLRSEQSWRVRDSVRTVPLTRDGTYAIDLHAGWNIISNPFDLDVSWSAVETANEGSLSPLWRFSGAFERASTFVSAQSGTAFYFLNDRDREVLHLPYPAFPGSASPAPSSSPSTPPTLTLTARQTDTGISRVQVGAHRNAEEGRDPYDQVAPPARFARPALRIAGSSEDGPPRQRHLAADYRSSASDGHTFPLTLRPDPDRPVTLQAEGLDAFDGQEIVLVDPATGESYDLRTTATVTLRPEAGPRSLRLLVGSADYVETKQSVALPGDLQFLPNYPNPFSDQTTLEYVLPDPAAVRLAVYDVLGRQVRVLVDQKQEAGRHTVQWDGHDESGRRMASGVYLARLVVDGTTQVRKMTFVR
jgi:subtilisin family serine protease